MVHKDYVLGQQSENHQPHRLESMGGLSANMTTNRVRTRSYFSHDPAVVEHDSVPRSPIMTEHEHGLGVSGLWRIRQQPLNCAQSLQLTGSTSRKASLNLQLPNQVETVASTSGPPSPTLNFTEDLTRFPSESLHSFSFAQKSGEFIHNRQNILKRSVDFISQNLGWGTRNLGIASAQARVSGDREAQGMLELLARAQLLKTNSISGPGHSDSLGPLTGPAFEKDAPNIFDMSFLNRSQDLTETEEVNISSLPITDLKEENILVSNQSRPNFSPKLSEQSRSITGDSPSLSRASGLRRTYTDIDKLSLQNKLLDALAKPYVAGDDFQENILPSVSQDHLSVSGSNFLGPVVHEHSSRWAPAAQAIFTTKNTSPYTILSANDLACLVFGVTKAEVRKMDILEVVQEERRAWLAEKLESHGKLLDPDSRKYPTKPTTNPSSTISLLLGRVGVTANLLNKPNSRQIQKQASKSQANNRTNLSCAADGKTAKNLASHVRKNSRGVLLCGDVVPIRKRNGATGSASLWVKEKRGSLIWVLEEINEDKVTIELDYNAKVTKIIGSSDAIWGKRTAHKGMDIGDLLPQIPRQGIDGRRGALDYAELMKQKFYTARNLSHANIPCLIERLHNSNDLRISSFPHIAGILVLSAQTLKITSSNSVFSAALFGQGNLDGKHITDIIPNFNRILTHLTEKDAIELVDGIVIPEHSFRLAQAFLALHNSLPAADSGLFRRDGLLAKHRDGSEIMVDAQLRVVKSDTKFRIIDQKVMKPEENSDLVSSTELVYALWITYSRQISESGPFFGIVSPTLPGIQTSNYQPMPGQTDIMNPVTIEPNEEITKKSNQHLNYTDLLQDTEDIKIKISSPCDSYSSDAESKTKITEVPKSGHKKTIDDFIILEEMGQGAYGQVKLAQYKKDRSRKVVLKHVTKRRILIDTWARDRRLGTVPLEIHVLDYLRRDGLQHPNIIEMTDFFEDDINYYIETLPHGLPGMDLFDYIELRANMGEAECRSIFIQVAQAICHLHTKASVVHRDIKDENVVLDGEGRIKLIDFGSAAYIKNGPFDVFVGTIDYAAPEVLAGKSYRGKEQDVWALGILLYTIVYKENPFYSIDEIMDRDLRVPHVMNEDNLDLIRAMLDRDVESRLSIEEVLEHPWCRGIDNETSDVRKLPPK
ncbi:hypothetical protein GcM1_219045 [Golovinomyces cichoracearum]|uniref:non-specific serine/threonine protein kinase n=1 Tax=Golovinomyces cichoracearum TaxID=62708 RepID=A0A420ISE6_9PEZI|nr:hypothetical protein GcM1_219045 [Golovinomyces cichoracearum]